MCKAEENKDINNEDMILIIDENGLVKRIECKDKKESK